MKLFGGLPPPAWLASEILASSSASPETFQRGLSEVILQHAARFALTPEELRSDLKRMGASPALVQTIEEDFRTKREALRRDLVDSLPSIHLRPFQADIVRLVAGDDKSDTTEITFATSSAAAMRGSTNESDADGRKKLTLVMDAKTTEELASALQEAIQALDKVPPT